MNVTCDKCGKRYVIPDEKLAGKMSVKIRCKQCQSLVSVVVGGAAAAASAAPVRAAAGGGVAPAPQTWEDERTRAMPPMDLTATWYAMIKGVQEGPFDVKQLNAKVAGGEVTLRTYLWKPGMDNWKRASDVPEVSPVFAGVSVGATATGPEKAAPQVQQRIPRKTMIQYDVATANEVPAPDDPTLREKRTSTRSSGLRKAVAPVEQPQRPLDDLFNDISGLHPKQDGNSGQHAAEPATDPKHDWNAAAPIDDAQAPVDPFALLSKDDGVQAPQYGEATRFFIAQAGVNKRNPWWKKLLFGVLLVGLPVGLLYTLASFRVVPLTVTRTNAQGETVEVEFFSGEGMAGIKDLLSGEAKKKRREAERLAAEQKRKAEDARKAALAAKGNAPGTTTPKPGGTGPQPSADFMKDFYGSSTGGVKIRVPKNRQEGANGQAVATAGLSAEAVSKVVGDKMKSFEACIEQSLRRNPNMKVGNITLNLTVGQSGAVKAAGVTPRKFEGSDWAQCMMGAGKRIIFPASDGETDLELPFKIGVAM